MFWMKTSLSARKPRSQASACGSFRSSTTLRLLRLTAWKLVAMPALKGGPQPRASSPSGRSILTTSAPSMARISLA